VVGIECCKDSCGYSLEMDVVVVVGVSDCDLVGVADYDYC
jgi:hypothetical protein